MRITKYKPITLANLDRLNGSAERKNAIRQMRAPLLSAFDIYRSHVSYRTVAESEERHTLIMEWYRDLLDLKQTALENVPEEIKPYIQ